MGGWDEFETKVKIPSSFQKSKKSELVKTCQALCEYIDLKCEAWSDLEMKVKGLTGENNTLWKEISSLRTQNSQLFNDLQFAREYAQKREHGPKGKSGEKK